MIASIVKCFRIRWHETRSDSCEQAKSSSHDQVECSYSRYPNGDSSPMSESSDGIQVSVTGDSDSGRDQSNSFELEQ